ncbi:50S ribosomal protein L18 [Halobacteriovorax sp. BALOs_7]|uniref:Large ribosomal subunit protein uL18 n=1 Tax=Halobacteriovorax vibrionivorans TaxID=2152716 RepID=A0ABY0IIX6_9BACT|nr:MULTISPECIES: 50S ribosomal protein L18 [Halobacteriovorax]AYF45880.1 50S ribosomal protein L18 [Halobacteriovorax sp. BALOs_7]RZF22919.1 50S ribosomal protein L18 [Halobacteriovorax vibrionivorans]TGD47288.1 50S ribosomal protein L18 [Halobacteriovorax sp. Y22]
MIRKPYGKAGKASTARRIRRKLAIRKKVAGNAERPRLSVNRTNKHITVQVIDDEANKTLFSVQTYGKNAVEGKCNVAGAQLVGAKLAENLKAKNISTAVFDRNGLKYHGVIKAVVESARENGIQI